MKVSHVALIFFFFSTCQLWL